MTVVIEYPTLVLERLVLKFELDIFFVIYFCLGPVESLMFYWKFNTYKHLIDYTLSSIVAATPNCKRQI